MIQAIVFDCFGVLYWDDLNRLYNLLDPKDFQGLNDLMHAFDHGYISQNDFVDQAAALAGVTAEEIQTVMRDKQSRNDPMIARVHELKKQYKTALLTNMGSDMLDTVFSQTETEELFDVVVVSGEVGMIKPSRGIFELTCERLGVAPEHAIFVDDRPVNTDGADHVGMKTILFTTNKQFEVELDRLTKGE